MPVMRVLHVISSVDRSAGGPVEGVFQQAAHGDVEGVTIDIVCLDPSDSPAVSSSPVRTFGLGRRGPRGNRSLPWVRYGYEPAMVPWLKANVHLYDVVVVDGLWNYSTMAACRALVGRDVPYVVFTHGMLDPWFQKRYPVKAVLKQVFWLFNEGRLLNHADAVLFTTEEESNVSRGAFWPYRVRERVVGYGTTDIPGDAATQAAAFRSALPALGSRAFLLFLGRIHEKKGCDLLIDAFAAVAPARPELDLVMAGPDQTGWKAELERRAREKGVEGRIHWPGMIGGEVKWGALRACEAFVLPSHQENFGVAVAEALAASKPVLISNKVQIWREIRDDGAGIVDEDDLPGTVRMLQDFLALDPQARAAMEDAAGACFRRRFEMSSVVKEINRVLRQVIARRGPPRPVALPSHEGRSA